jgi:carboxymethylenebutenolidase
MTDMVALKRYLTALPGCNGKVAALGICAGGELAFLSATRLGAHAAATYHGTRIERHLGEAQGLAVPVSLHYGDRDELIPLPTVEAIKQGLSGCRQADIHVYPGAAHGFSGAGKPSYHPFAALTSDRRVQEVFGPLRAAA